MKRFINMLIRNWSGSSIKIIMTLGTVALGTGILILTHSAGIILEEQIQSEIEKEGIILHVANGEWDSQGKIDQKRPPEWDAQAPGIIVSEIEAVKAAVPLITPPFNKITTGGKSYNLRNAVGSGPGYFDIFSLEIVSGVPMVQEDYEMGLKKVWISEETAGILFGSPEKAIGQWIQPPGEMLRRGPGRTSQNMVIQFSVAGVFASPGEIARRSYGIGDLVYPATSLFSAGGNIQMMKDMMSGTFVLQAEGNSVEKLSSAITEVIGRNYSDDISIVCWEGSQMASPLIWKNSGSRFSYSVYPFPSLALFCC